MSSQKRITARFIMDEVEPVSFDMKEDRLPDFLKAMQKGHIFYDTDEKRGFFPSQEKLKYFFLMDSEELAKRDQKLLKDREALAAKQRQEALEAKNKA